MYVWSIVFMLIFFTIKQNIQRLISVKGVWIFHLGKVFVYRVLTAILRWNKQIIGENAMS